MSKNYLTIIDFIIILLLSKNSISQIKILLTLDKSIDNEKVILCGYDSYMNIYALNKITNEKKNMSSYLKTFSYIYYDVVYNTCFGPTYLYYSFEENEIFIIEINKVSFQSLFKLFSNTDISSITMVTMNNNNLNIENFGDLFQGCIHLTSVDLSNFNFSNAKSFSRMFRGDKNLEIINFPKNINISLVEDFTDMFEDCSKLKSIDLSNFNFNNAKQIIGMFNGCSNLEKLILPNKEFLNLRFINDFSNLFLGCSKLKSVDLSNINANNITSLAYMFDGCSNLMSIDLSKFKFNNIKYLKRMFFGCENLNLIKWPTELIFSQIEDFSEMFSNCYNLISITLPNINFDHLLFMMSMFSNCTKLKFVSMSSYSSSNNLTSFVSCKNMFSGCTSLASFDLTNFTFSGIVDLSSMFTNCIALISIELIGNLNNTGIVKYPIPQIEKYSDKILVMNFVFKTTAKDIIKNCYSLKELNFFNLKIDINYNESITENAINLEGCLFNEYTQNIKECSKYIGFKNCGNCINQNIEEFCLMKINQNNYKFYYIDTEFKLPFKNRSCYWSRNFTNFLEYKFINNSKENKSYFTNFCKNCEICSIENKGCIKCNNSKGYYEKENQKFNCSREPPAENYIFDSKAKEWKICGERCQKCSRQTNSLIDQQCTKCTNNYFPFKEDYENFINKQITGFNCYNITEIKKNYFINSENNIEKCDISCLECRNRSDFCIICNTNYYNILDYRNGTCFPNPLPKYGLFKFENQIYFKQCFSLCKYCIQITDSFLFQQCYECDNDDYILDIYSYEKSYCIPKDKSNSTFIKEQTKWYIDNFKDMDELNINNKKIIINYDRLLNNMKYNNISYIRVKTCPDHKPFIIYSIRECVSSCNSSNLIENGIFMTK